MTIQENVTLADYTTFKLGGQARFFAVVSSEEELIEVIAFCGEKNIPFFVLGGGSNLLISDHGYAGLVIKMEITGVNFDGPMVECAAGENWDDFVRKTIEHGLCGLENLSAIPGTVGAAPVQNIGAYGVEVQDFIYSVRAYDTRSREFVELGKKDCLFAYRDSLFKNQKGRYIVTKVSFKLKSDGLVNLSYKDLDKYFAEKKMGRLPTPPEIREAVIAIRREKLPDWKTWGTAGSFFKNPVIPLQQYVDLKIRYPDLPGYPECDGGFIKVSLGWILDKVCELKGKCFDKVCVYEKQALVIAVKPGALAQDVRDLTRKIHDVVYDKTNIKIEAEVEWVN